MIFKMDKIRAKKTIFLPIIIISICFVSILIIQLMINLVGIDIGFQPELDAHEMWYVP